MEKVVRSVNMSVVIALCKQGEDVKTVTLEVVGKPNRQKVLVEAKKLGFDTLVGYVLKESAKVRLECPLDRFVEIASKIMKEMEG